MISYLAPESAGGTGLAFPGGQEAFMFTFAAGLVGIVGIFYVRRRFSRKRQQANG